MSGTFSAPEVIFTVQFYVQFCSEIGLINYGISQNPEIMSLINASFDHCRRIGFFLE